jgi:hypothetical protein
MVLLLAYETYLGLGAVRVVVVWITTVVAKDGLVLIFPSLSRLLHLF